MATATSVISICNQALLGLGEAVLASSTDFTSVSSTSDSTVQQCATRFDDEMKYAIRRIAPKCFKTRVALVENASAPAFGYDNAFDLPANCIRVITAWLDDGVPEYAGHREYWRLEGRQILTDAAGVNIEYIYYPTESHGTANNGTWNTYFAKTDAGTKKVLIEWLKYAFTNPITGNSSEEERRMMQLEEIMASAGVADYNEGLPFLTRSNIMAIDSGGRWV